MSMDLTGITNKNEYYTNHYFSTVFEENTRATISGWNAAARESEEIKTPWSLLRQNARQYYTAHDKFVRSSVNLQVLANIKALVGNYLKSLGYPEAKPEVVAVDDSLSVPVYLEMTKSNGAPLLWVLLSASKESDAGIMESFVFNANDVDDDAAGTLYKGVLGEIANEDLVTKILFGTAEPPRFVMLIGMNQIALIDRNKWNEKRYLQFELEEIFSRLENTTLQAMSVLLHKDSLCPDDGKVLLDELDEQSQKNASGVSQDLKYALRESIELLGNEVLYDMKARLGRDLDADPVDAGQLTLECLRYMYRMLFVLFIESRPELGYAPIKAQSYYSGYSLESLRDIADNIRDDVNEVGDGYYLHETLAKLYELIYDGYPKTEDELKKATGSDSLHDMFLIAPLKAHIFDPEYTKMITAAKLRNSCMLRMHRAKHLASKCEGQQRILMTTFTANLAADIRENLRKICTLEELRRIEVIHLDAWVNQFLRESGFSAQIGYDDVINPLWERAVLLANIDLPYETTFYEEEWNRIVIAQEALTLEKYVKATRNGRGTRLDRKKRMQVWKVFENYQNLMKENQIRDINTAMYESTKLLQSAGRKPRYASIIIDEGQDFSDNAYRLIRALAGEEHPNDIFIVGDSHQRIYRNYPTLSKCGINVRGRSSILKINYRTTEEIRKHAFALLNGISFDDLDEDLDLGDKCQSLTHGEKPIVENFENANDEFDFLLREVKKLKENGVSLTDICVVARTKKLVDDYIALFTRAGIRSYAIKRNKVDDRSFDGLRVATMHRVKGLEFKYVFIAAVNNRIIPLPFAINKTDAVSEVESITSEKCLLYVAMTRAQKGVYITSYGRPSEFLV